MEKKSFLWEFFDQPQRVWEVRCNRELRSPLHPFLGSYNLIKDDIIKALQSMSLQTTLDGKIIHESNNSSSSDKESFSVVQRDMEQFKKEPIDVLLTTGIHVGALVNPNSVAMANWNVKMIHWWLCREPKNPADDLILNRVSYFRRYGTYRQFEVLCNFKKNTDKRSRPSKLFWIHINCLLHTYRRKLIEDYSWKWSKVESDFYESQAEEDNYDVMFDDEGNVSSSDSSSSLVSLNNCKASPENALQPVLYRSYPINCLNHMDKKK